MVLIEFFDKTPIENVAGALGLRPETLVFLGDRKDMERRSPACRALLDAVGLGDTELLRYPVPRNDLGAVTAALEKLLNKHGSLCFDLTGGDQIALTAAGMLYARYPDRISLRRFNIETGRFYDITAEARTRLGQLPGLTVAENILLHGGAVVWAKDKKGGTVTWDLSPEFRQDVAGLWDICRRNCSLWNSQISALGALEKIRQDTGDPLHLRVNVSHAVDFLQHQKLKFKSGETYLDLQLAGLIEDLEYDGRTFSFRYKSPQVKKALDKAGTILELHTYLTALDLRDEAGDPLVGDALTGVLLDWDGRVNAGADTENEIDVMLMQGLVPWFVSCKNGAVGHEELYKLSTVAERFGGPYGKKLLIATTLGRDIGNRDYFLGRGADMGITVLDGVHELSGEAFADKLRGILCG